MATIADTAFFYAPLAAVGGGASPPSSLPSPYAEFVRIGARDGAAAAYETREGRRFLACVQAYEQTALSSDASRAGTAAWARRVLALRSLLEQCAESSSGGGLVVEERRASAASNDAAVVCCACGARTSDCCTVTLRDDGGVNGGLLSPCEYVCARAACSVKVRALVALYAHVAASAAAGSAADAGSDDCRAQYERLLAALGDVRDTFASHLAEAPAQKRRRIGVVAAREHQ